MALVYRETKGQLLTIGEGDNNIRELDEIPNGKVFPKTQGVGIKIDQDSPDWGWHDITGVIRAIGGASDPEWVAYQGAIKQPQFDVGEEVFIEFHLPHDYAMGTNIYIHAHWSHNNSNVTTGGVTWAFEGSYAKGHGQAYFNTPVVLNVQQDASLVRYQHMIAEDAFSASAGAGGLIVKEDIEVDGLVLCRVSLAGNTMDDGAKPFLHFVDIHYQSTGMGTKQKAPNFWT